jgi:hypothetical protein
MRHLLSQKVQQAPGTNPEEEEVAEATEDEVAQAVVAAVMAISIRAEGVVEVEVPNRRATRIDRRAIQTELRNQGQCATGVRKRGIGSKIASDI